MNRKRPHIIFVFPAIMLLISLNACLSKNDEKSYNDENDFVAKVLYNKTVTIIGYVGTSKDVRIPPRIGGLPVTKIEGGAFYRKGLTSVIIPNGVTHIGNTAFWDNKLVHVIIPNTIIEIGTAAFASNNITEIVLPDHITEIGYAMFMNSELTIITIPEGVRIIGDSAFENNRLTEIIIPNSVVSIGRKAFSYNHYNVHNIYNDRNNITKVTIGDNVELDMDAIRRFTFFYNYCVMKRGGTYIYNDHYWMPEDKSIPVYRFDPEDGWNSPDIAFLLDMPDLEEVRLRDNDLLTDITPLSELTKIKTLHIYNCPNIESLKPLSSLTNLERLYLTHNSNYDYRDIASLQKLESLTIRGDEIDLSSIGQLHFLKYLYIGTSAKIENINALQTLVNLETLEIGGVANLDISWISGLRNLTKFEMMGCSINDISPLANLPNLVRVELTGNRIKNIAPLLNSNSIKYIRVWAHEVEAGISDDLRSRFEQKNVYLDTFYDYR